MSGTAGAAAPTAGATAFDERDHAAMRIALDQALNAELAGEVPVGAVVMRDGQVIATGYNRPVTTHDPTGHAEIVALRHAAQLLGNYRLPQCEVFVTLEPCAMCAMALLHARVKRVVFAAPDPKTGAAGSVLDLFGYGQLNHQTVVQGGLLAEPAGGLLRHFFAQRRAEQRAARTAAVSSAGAVSETEAASAADESGVGLPGEPESIPAGETMEIDDAAAP